MRKILSIFTALLMGFTVFMGNPIYADGLNLNNEKLLNPRTITEWYYEIVNEDREVVETGIFGRHKDGEITPYASVGGLTIRNGYGIILRPVDEPRGYLLPKGAKFKITYDLNRAAWAESSVKKVTEAVPIWSATRNVSSLLVTGALTETNYYRAEIWNVDTDPFTVIDFSFTSF